MLPDPRVERWILKRSIIVRGLGDLVKGQEIFNWLRAKKYSVHFIQEMHSTEDNKSD